MRSSRLSLSYTASVVILFLATSVPARIPLNKQQAELPDFNNFPIVDFTSNESVDPKVKEIREAKGRKYSRKYMLIGEETAQIVSDSHWDMDLPALPVARSAAI